MFAEEELIPISALQHFVVCPRQCALIHVEQTWADNFLTADGKARHQRVDRGGAEQRGAERYAYGVPLRSLNHGLVGRADMVEFHKSDAGEIPFPVEHKRGKPKRGDEDRVQLCAQALCLEEMLDTTVPCGALFYGTQRRRFEVDFDEALRQRVAEVAAGVRALIEHGTTPPPPDDAPCSTCSLEPFCRPDMRGRSVNRWVERQLSRELA